MKLTLCLLLVCSVAFLGAADKPATPQITAIYPSAGILPANHLKFYLHFSEPMRQGVFLDHCKLLDDQEQPVQEPFRETELWSEDSKRLTLWLHPGRQKTGVNLNTEFGPVLLPGKRYTLVISGEWPSADGIPIGTVTKKAFITGLRATAQLDINAWQIYTPDKNSINPLRISFPAPLDHALLTRCLRVTTKDGKPMEGTGATIDGERGWSFTPAAFWPEGDYLLRIESILEDLAGNSLARPFEVDIQLPRPANLPEFVELKFRPNGK